MHTAVYGLENICRASDVLERVLVCSETDSGTSFFMFCGRKPVNETARGISSPVAPPPMWTQTGIRNDHRARARINNQSEPAPRRRWYSLHDYVNSSRSLGVPSRGRGGCDDAGGDNRACGGKLITAPTGRILVRTRVEALGDSGGGEGYTSKTGGIALVLVATAGRLWESETNFHT